ncbi:hypothetical protein KW795_02930, partial [Candidatus Microgenomates bacterium]|nr:hypothetical protein [Candidatus Microgenomates bacterium]
IVKLKSFIQKLKEGIKQKQLEAKQGKKNGVGGSQEKVNIFKGNKLLMVALIIFIVLVILLVFAAVYKSFSGDKKPTVRVTPAPQAIQTATPSAITTPSRYATDSAVLELETKINNLDKDMNSTNINEPQLSIPQLDFNINFK